MNEIIDLSGIVFPWWIPTVIVGGLLGIGVLVYLWDAIVGEVIIAGVLIFGGIVGFLLTPKIYVEDEVTRRVTYDLVEYGYSNVELNKGAIITFTGSKDGLFVSGIFLPATEPNTYNVQVVNSN